MESKKVAVVLLRRPWQLRLKFRTFLLKPDSPVSQRKTTVLAPL
jgi:hypothetical protein